LNRQQQKAIHSKNNRKGIRTPVNYDSYRGRKKLRIDIGMLPKEREEQNRRYLGHASDYDLHEILDRGQGRKTNKQIKDELYQNPRRQGRF